MFESEQRKLCSLNIAITITQMATSQLCISHIKYLRVTSTHPSMHAHRPHNKQNSQLSAQSQHISKLYHLNLPSTQELNNRHHPGGRAEKAKGRRQARLQGGTAGTPALPPGREVCLQYSQGRHRALGLRHEGSTLLSASSSEILREQSSCTKISVAPPGRWTRRGPR